MLTYRMRAAFPPHYSFLPLISIMIFGEAYKLHILLLSSFILSPNTTSHVGINTPLTIM